ncbi:MAG: PqqD family protein [Clostridia bacterium]|nr:PqqD family protein [Clostridia bacterium]
MKLKEGFVLRQVAGSYVVVAVGLQTLDFKGMIRLNETGAFLWKQLAENECTEESLVAAMTSEYDVDDKTAAVDVSAFVRSLQEADLLV